jgi:type IV pilus assembly protein PilV
MSRIHTMAAARGFSLVEIMVAVVVICVGLLGVAKMEALSLSATTEARLRSIAAFQAASFASSMHANRAYWAGPPPTLTTVTGGGALTITSVDATLQGDATADLGALGACSGVAGAVAGCNQAVEMAAVDLARWATNLNAMLPNPLVNVNCTTTDPAACTIYMYWTETAVASNSQEVNVTAQGTLNLNNPQYVLYVQP